MSRGLVIGILNWNGRSVTVACLESIFEVTEYKDYTVVVVDNGSTDGSVDLFRSEFPQVEVIENETNRGVAAGFNQILSWSLDAGADHVVLMNNDTRITDPDWLGRLVGAIESEETLGIVGCLNLHPDGSVDHDGEYLPLPMHATGPLDARTGNEYNRYERNRTGSSANFEYMDVVEGSAFIISVELIEEIGMFDEIYSPIYSEEYDYCLRAWDAGYRVGYLPDLAVEHLAQHSDIDFIGRKFYLARNDIRFMLINYPATWLVYTLPAALLNTAGFVFLVDGHSITVREEFRREPVRAIRAAIGCIFWNIVQLPAIYRRRKARRQADELLK